MLFYFVVFRLLSLSLLMILKVLQNFGLVLTSLKFWTWQWRTLKKSMLQLPNNNCARLFSDNSGEQAKVLQLWHPVSHDSLNSKGPDVWHLSPGMQNDCY